MPSSMNVWAIAVHACQRLQLPAPALGSFLSATDGNLVLLEEILITSVWALRDEFPWPELQREYTFTLATSTENYQLPRSFNSFLTHSQWNRTDIRTLTGPLNALEWQNYKSGDIATPPTQRFRIKGWADNQLYIDPTPTSSDNGKTVAFEYISKNAMRPRPWAASTAFAGSQYCSNNGRIYDRGGAGAATTGSTAPTHTTGTESDGTINWAVVSQLNEMYEQPSTDYDVVVLNYAMVIDEVVWRFRRERGLAYEDLRAEAEKFRNLRKIQLQGASVVSVNSIGRGSYVIGEDNYPRTLS